MEKNIKRELTATSEAKRLATQIGSKEALKIHWQSQMQC